jgi:O-antigen/teichoic acid export membrane protein
LRLWFAWLGIAAFPWRFDPPNGLIQLELTAPGNGPEHNLFRGRISTHPHWLVQGTMAAPQQPTPEPGRTPTAKRGSYRAGFLFGSLSFSFTIGIGFLSTIVTARLYGVDVIGQYALVWAPVAAMWVLSTIKEQQALIKEITGLAPRQPRVSQLFAAVFTFSVGLTVAVAILDAVVCLFVFPGPLDAPQLLAPALVSIAGYVLVTNTGWNIDSIFSAFVAGRQLFWVRLNEAISFIVIATALGFAWRSVWGLVIATIGASLAALIHRAIAVRPFIRARLSREEYRAGLEVLPALLRFGLRAAPGQMAQGISQQGGIWAIGMVAPVAVVGAYSRALVIPRSLQQASMRITEVLYPTLVGRHTEGDGHGFDRALIDSIRYEVIVMLMLAAAIGGAAHSVLEIFGPGFTPAVPALILLALFPALASITVTQTQALWAVNRPGLTSVVALIRLTVTIVLLVLLTPAMNMVGPALALLAGFLVTIVLSGGALRHHLTRPLRATWPLRERCVLAVAYAAGFGAAHGTESALSSIVALPLCLLAGAVAFTIALLLCRGLNQRDGGRLAEAVEWGRSRFGREKEAEAVSPPGAVPFSAGEGDPTGTAPAAARGTFLRSTRLDRDRD